MPRYSAKLLAHAQAPCNGREMEDADAVGRADLDGRAPRVAVFLKGSEDRVVDATFQAFGCGVTLACGSVLTERIKGLTYDACRDLTTQHLADDLDGIPADKQFCAELLLRALQHALATRAANVASSPAAPAKPNVQAN